MSTPTAGPPTPDARQKVNAAHKPVIAERISAGESRAQVAADYGVDPRHIGRIVSQETKTAEIKTKREKAAKKRKTNNGVIQGDFRIGAVAIEDESPLDGPGGGFSIDGL